MATNTIPRFEQLSSRRDEIQASISVGDIHVGGDVQGNIVVGNHNVIGDNNIICEVNNSQGVVIELHTPPTIKRRDTNAPPPRIPRGFVGREDELYFLEQQVAERGAALVFAHDGIGKTYLIKKAANSASALAMPDGIVNVEGLDEGRTLGLQDIFQRLFDALYESSPPVKVTTSIAQGYLSNTQSLVTLDHLELSPDIVNRLPDMLPKAALIATSQNELFEDVFEAVSLPPLARDKTVELFAAKSGIVLDDTTQPVIERICSALDDVPLAIAIIANAVRQKRLSFDTVADALASIQPLSQSNIQAAIDRSFGLIYSILDGDERDMLAFTAAAPGNSVDRLWLESLSGSERTSQTLESLELLYANSPRLRLPDGIRQTLQTGVGDLPERREYLLRHLLAELETRSLDFEFVSGELGNILGLLQWTADQQHWSDVVALGKAVDPYLTLHGLWDAWEVVLKRILEAGQYLQDLAVRGWALHQLGTREIGVGGFQKAANLLLRALEIRASLGDRVGVAYTLHNLNIILPASGGGESEGQNDSGNPPDNPSLTDKIKELLNSIRETYIRFFGDIPWIFKGSILMAGILLATLAALFAFRPSLALRKEADTTRFNPVGQVIHFTYTIDNAGFRRLPGPILVTDIVTDSISDVYCEPVDTVGNEDEFLDWNERLHCNGQYIITEADIESGSVTHTSRAIAPQREISSPEKTVTLNFDPRFLFLTVKPSTDGYTREGEEVRYSFIIENIGLETLDGPLAVADDRMEVSCPDVTAVGNNDAYLDPEESLICHATYTITEEDIDQGTVTNTSIASAGEIELEPVTATIYRMSPATSLVLHKLVDRETYQDIGEEIRYDYIIINDGDERLIGPVIVKDDAVEVVCMEVQKVGNQDEWLDPGERIECNAIYTITDKDVERGSVTNTAQASAGEIDSEKQSTTIYFKTSPLILTLGKFADREIYRDAGEEVRYKYIVSNGGSVPVPGPIAVIDDKVEVECPDLRRVGNQDESLDPGEDLLCTAIYTIREEDVRFKSVTNTAWAEANDVISELQSLTIHSIPPSPERNPLPILRLSKIPEPDTYTQDGEIVQYHYFVTNTGSGSTNGPVIVEDDSVKEITCPDLETIGDQDTVFDPDETVICVGSYLINEEDVQLGLVTNTAQARAGEVSSNPTTVTIYEKALTLSISANLEAYEKVNEEIKYSYNVTGRSKAPLDTPVSVLDDTMQVTCPEFSTVGNLDVFLDWNETVTCSATYVISQADIDISQPGERGSVTNQAVAYSGEVRSNPDTHTIPGPIPAPALSLIPTPKAEPPHYDSVDQVITFTYVIKNTGNVTLSPELVVTDGNDAEPALECNHENQKFAPGEAATCTETYIISQTDFNFGNSMVTKRKSASGFYFDGIVTSPTESVTVSCLYPREGWLSFVVGPNEPLERIISWYDGISLSDIQKANCMGALREISPGQTLYVPEPPPLASVSGIIRDSAGIPLAGVTVTLMNNSGFAVRLPQRTGVDGSYSFEDLEPGVYRIFRHSFTLYRDLNATQDFVILPIAQ